MSLRPYSGRAFFARTREDYETAHEVIFKTPDVLTCAQGGRFSGGEGRDGIWTYLLWATKPAYLAHELSHVVLHTFQRAGIDPRDAGGEPFCYMLSQLLMDVQEATRKPKK